MDHKLACFATLGMLVAGLAPAAAQCLKIKEMYLETEHESGGFLTKPEIEVFQSQGLLPSFTSQKADRKAIAVFNGGDWVSPLQQGSRPDINGTGRWYTLNPPVIVTGTGAGVLLVEDDTVAGTFYGPSSFWNGFFCQQVYDPVVPAGLLRCQTPSFSTGDDDVFRGMLVLTGHFPSFPDVTLDLGEWRVKVDSSCF